MGSHSIDHLAYIAGFLDGDGSLMLQLKKRKDGALKRRFMCTICFYQDTRHEKPLHWIRRILKIGYISRRNDGMSELRINGFQQTRDILALLLPFLRFKTKQANVLYKASVLLSAVPTKSLSSKELRRLIAYILAIQKENYVTRRKKTEKELKKMAGLTP